MPAAIRIRAHWTRERRIAELLVILWVIGLSDLGLTLWAHLYTPFTELNPLAALFLRSNALAQLAAFKCLCMAVATLTLWITRHTRRCEAAIWAMTVLYFALLVRWSMYTQGALGN
jgi:hypothetical protein